LSDSYSNTPLALAILRLEIFRVRRERGLEVVLSVIDVFGVTHRNVILPPLSEALIAPNSRYPFGVIIIVGEALPFAKRLQSGKASACETQVRDNKFVWEFTYKKLIELCTSPKTY
jgi:hypothetical protein